MFIYFWERERQRAWAGEGQRERERQNPKQAPGSELSAQSLMWGSNSRTVRSWPELMSKTWPIEPPRRPQQHFFLTALEEVSPSGHSVQAHPGDLPSLPALVLKWRFLFVWLPLTWVVLSGRHGDWASRICTTWVYNGGHQGDRQISASQIFERDFRRWRKRKKKKQKKTTPNNCH